MISVQQKARILRMMDEFIGTDDIASDNTPEMNVLKAAGITEITEDPALKRQFIRELRRIFDFRLSAIIEEPEQNLFLLAQKELVEFLVRETNEGDGSLLLTTHSPYVLSVLNNLIFAGEHSRKKGINEIISKSLQIRYKEISAYYFSDGSCSSIMDADMRCINPENIDSCSVDINHTYSLMENIVYGCWERIFLEDLHMPECKHVYVVTEKGCTYRLNNPDNLMVLQTRVNGELYDSRDGKFWFRAESPSCGSIH